MSVPADQIDVPNPKDVISKALPQIQNLQVALSATWADIMLGMWEGKDDDATQALSMPVFMIVQAVNSMQQVKDIGEKAEEEEKKDLILTIVTALLLFVPFIGDVAEAVVDMAWLGRALALISDAGNVALTAIDIVSNPEGAPILILNMLLAGNSRTPKGFADMARSRRAIKPEDLSMMGALFKANDDKLQKNCPVMLFVIVRKEVDLTLKNQRLNSNRHIVRGSQSWRDSGKGSIQNKPATFASDQKYCSTTKKGQGH